MTVVSYTKAGLLASVAVLALTATANAGGFAIREQSAEFQGMSFAGNAAGGSLSSMFWNSAAAASRDGMNFESAASALMPRANVTVDKVTATPTLDAIVAAQTGGATTATKQYAAASRDADGISPTALVAASYGNYQIGNVYVGMGINAPFGLTTEPNNTTYVAAPLALTSRLIAFNFNPTVAMKVMPGVTIGIGAQIQTAEGTFRFAETLPTAKTASFEGNGWGFGGTAGIIIEPMAGTTIGAGYRSRMTQEIDGQFMSSVGNVHGVANLHLPDIVSISLKQAITPVMRVAATFEWSSWSNFTELKIVASEDGRSKLGDVKAGNAIAAIPLQWSDGWMVAVGGEYDLTRTLTARAGFAYEKSPVDDPTKRAISIPDANRYWMSFGASWKALENTSIDLAWSHVFIEESQFDRNNLAPYAFPTAYANFQGTIKSSLDIVSVGLKTKF